MQSTETEPWYRSTLAIALAGSVLMWAAQPPLALGWLGWIAPVPWLLLVREPMHSPAAARIANCGSRRSSSGWRRSIGCGCRTRPCTSAGSRSRRTWRFTCRCSSALTRRRPSTSKLPLWLAAPVVWTGLELARAHVMTGFMMGSLAHTQAPLAARDSNQRPRRRIWRRLRDDAGRRVHHMHRFPTTIEPNRAFSPAMLAARQQHLVYGASIGCS